MTDTGSHTTNPELRDSKPRDSKPGDPNLTDPNLRNPRLGGLVLGSVGAALFSLKGVVMKLAFAQGASVELMMALRMGIALPVFLYIGLRAAKSRRDVMDGRTFMLAAGLGVLSYYGCTWLDFTGLQYISAQLERLILYTYPTITALLAWIFLGDRITWRHTVALILSYTGIAVLFGQELGRFGPDAGLGAALVFASAALFAVYFVASKPVIMKLGSALFTSVAMAAAAVAILLHFSVQTVQTGMPEVTLSILGLGLVLAVACTILPSFMMAEAVARIGPGPTSAVGGVGPAVTAGIAVMVLGEPFGWPQALALFLTVGGVMLLAGHGWPRFLTKRGIFARGTGVRP